MENGKCLRKPTWTQGRNDSSMWRGHAVSAAQTDSLLAEATAHLVWAYEAIDQFSQNSTKPWTSPTFLSTCRLLCATLAAIDEFSESVGPIAELRSRSR